MTNKQPEPLIRADELEAIGAESSLARAMAAHTIRLLYKENEALRAALAQPEQEPVAWTLLLTGEHHGIVGKAGEAFVNHPEHYMRVNVYTAPPQREWQGLPDEEITRLRHLYDPTAHWSLVAFARAIEAKLKEKNHG